jgi:hypothetical protein
MKLKEICDLKRAAHIGARVMASIAWRVDEPVAIQISRKAEEIPDPLLVMRTRYQQGGWVVASKRASFVKQCVRILLEKESLC